MAGTFNFCPTTLVPETMPPEPSVIMSLNGWAFSAKPTVPYQKTFKVTLYGLRWYLNNDGTFNTATDPTRNARVLEQFYETNGAWDNFAWQHPHFGSLVVRFKAAVILPAAIPNSNGLCPPVEITLVHHNPSFV